MGILSLDIYCDRMCMFLTHALHHLVLLIESFSHMNPWLYGGVLSLHIRSSVSILTAGPDPSGCVLTQCLCVTLCPSAHPH